MEDQIIQIDIDQVLRDRVPKWRKWMPRWLVRQLEKLICQDKINELLRLVGNRKGVEAVRMALDHMKIKVFLHGFDDLDPKGRYTFASNHPLGGLDGLSLISEVGQRYNGNIKFLVNDLLMAVEPLKDIFLPVNKYGRMSREAAVTIGKATQSDAQLFTFPAGLCSRKQDDGSIADLKWNKAVVTMSARTNRDVVPVYFDAQNSKWFYRLARWREKLGIKFNIEMILLPKEMFKKEGATFNIYFGTPVPHDTLDISNAEAETLRLRQLTYALAPKADKK